MYQLFSAVTAAVLIFQFSAQAKSLEFVPEKRKPAVKRAPVEKPGRKIAYAEFPEVMSYHDLMSLPPYKRIAYIKGIRAMLVELSQRAQLGQGTLVADQGIEFLMHPEKTAESESSYAVLLSIFDQIIPQAHAVTSYDVRFDGINGRHCSAPDETIETMVTVAGDKICFNKIRYSTWARNTPDSAGVLERGYQIRRQTRLEEKRAELRDTQSFQESFNPSQRQAPASDQARLAELKDVLNQKTEQVEVDRQAEQKRNFQLQAQRQQFSNDPAYNESFNKDKRPAPASDQTRTAEMKDYLNRQTQKVNEDEVAARNEALRGTSENPSVAGADKETAPAADAPEKAELEKRGEAEIVRQMEENRKAESAATVATAKGDKAPVEAKPMTAQSAAVENLPPSTPEICKKTLLKCEAKLEDKLDAKGKKAYGAERSKSLKAFRDSSPTACISSGNMSAYNNGEVKAGNCKPVSNFCFNPEDERCTGKDKYQAGSSRKERENGKAPAEAPKDGKVFTCKKGALCNPLVFGALKNGNGICVETGGSDLTVICNRNVEMLIAKKEKNYEPDILKNGAAGVANAWDDWRDAFNKTCRGDSASQSAHCEECTVIGKRLRDLHRLAEGTCDSAKKYKELPGATTTSETTK